jgi:hypothetical protein
MPPDVWDSLDAELRRKLAAFIAANEKEFGAIAAGELQALIVRAATPQAVVLKDDYITGEDVPLSVYRDALDILAQSDEAIATVTAMEADDAERTRALWKKVLDFAAQVGTGALMSLGKLAADKAINLLDKNT